MDPRDDMIRELAKSHGVDNMPDDQVREVKSTISGAYIDSVLDGSLNQPEGERK